MELKGGKYYLVPCARDSAHKTFRSTDLMTRTPCRDLMPGYLMASGIKPRPSGLESDALTTRLPTVMYGSYKHQGGRIRVWRHRGESTLAVCIRLRHTDPSPGVMLFPFPAHPPDVSPIKNIWCMFAEQLALHHTTVIGIDELCHRVEAAWASVPVHATQSLFDSMSRRISVVIIARGGCSE
ncbi:odorant receptor [Trichonephila clavipes]|nr:odorant receptor [Trichonephila clavipes]